MNRQKAKKIIIGLILLALGVAWLGNAVDLWDFSVFFPGWWAALLMICFLVSVVGDGPNVVNVLGMLIFGAVVLKSNGMIPDFVNLWLVAFALAVILFGGKLIFSVIKGNRHVSSFGEAGSDGDPASDGKFVSYTFASEALCFSGKTVHACGYGISFGSLTLDFSGAVFAEDASLAVRANFGEVKVLLPPGIKAESVNSAAFASIKNSSQGNVTVKCQFDCAFGSIEVKNG